MTYGILLAAGLSSRMGRPKQLLAWGDRPLVRHVAEQALKSRITGLVIVIGAAADLVRAALAGLDGPVLIVENPDYASGQASSLRSGLSALPATARAALVLLVDQPLIRPDLINRLIDEYEAHPQALAVMPRYKGKRGNPVLLAHGLFESVRGVAGDAGARQVLAEHASQIRQLELDDPAVVMDLDTPEDYTAMQAG